LKVSALGSMEHGKSYDADLVIVGSGPAGLSIARQFIGTSTRVIILECGALNEEAREVGANEQFESVGAPRCMEPRLVRNKVFGGSSRTWAGRCTTFNDIDFEAREWVPGSGWPVAKADVARYVDRAGEIMHLGPHVYDSDLWSVLGRSPPRGEVETGLRPTFWQFSSSADHPFGYLDFGKEFLKLEASNIHVITHATVTHVNTDNDGRKLISLEVSGGPDHRITIVPRAAVLCAGGIENARLLLCSNRTRSKGVGNERDTVGRYLMDHARTVIGKFDGRAAQAVKSRFNFVQIRNSGRTHFYAEGVALSEDVQRQEKLLNCAIFMTDWRSKKDPWDALKRLRNRASTNRLKDALYVASQPRLMAEGAYQRLVAKRNVTHRLDKLNVECVVEQVPDPESRVLLSDRRDAFDMPIPRIAWKISELEKRSVAKLGGLFARQMDRLGLPQLQLADWIRDGRMELATFRDAAHPTGATRMSEDPAQGVVDKHCQVHGVEGLYVAGSSVFPTAGHANPTLMIVAMALRLADRLRDTRLACLILSALLLGEFPVDTSVAA
jgi:choline dehydrogenase-like flavoprotein